MQDEQQSPGMQAGASRDQLGRWSHQSVTVSERRAQMLACRFSLSPWIAQDIALLCFGHFGDD